VLPDAVDGRDDGTSMSLMKFSTKFMVSGTLQLYLRSKIGGTSTSSKEAIALWVIQ
jgi:hypothetical protein